jgi:hypothetical protein
MHDFDDAGTFTFDITGDLADHVIADPYTDDTTHVDDTSSQVGPQPAPDNDDITESSTPATDSAAPTITETHLTGNPALDIDLSDDDTGAESPVTADDAAVHGNPVEWTINWFYQQLDGYCGPAVVGQLVAEYTGANITDPQHLVDRAVELGLMSADDPTGGMTLPDIERLLEDQGVPASISSGSLDDLRARLDDGHAVIAMVDSGEIWQPDRETTEDDTPDHVLVVAGIDDDRGVVILSDPGVPNGSQLEVPIEQFEQAWADSGHQMLVADNPDPDLIPAATESIDHSPTEPTTTTVAASNSTRTTVISLRS